MTRAWHDSVHTFAPNAPVLPVYLVLLELHDLLNSAAGSAIDFTLTISDTPLKYYRNAETRVVCPCAACDMHIQ